MKSMAGAAALAAADARPMSSPVFLSTWAHGKAANERAAEVFKARGSLLDAVEKGINVPENDPNVMSVGYGGLPNADGVVELSARSDSEVAEVTVRDQGEDLADGDLQRFFRIGFARQGRAGVGLTVAKQIVKGHGGSISVKRADHGVELVVRFPLENESDS